MHTIVTTQNKREKQEAIKHRKHIHCTLASILVLRMLLQKKNLTCAPNKDVVILGRLRLSWHTQPG